MEEDAQDAIELAQGALYGASMLFLSGRARPKKALHDSAWALFAEALRTLAVLQDETPREICEQAFGFCPTDEEWREEMLPERKRRAQEVDFGD
jgi:hypothetical protein